MDFIVHSLSNVLSKGFVNEAFSFTPDGVVQETVEGHTVTAIGESAFEGSTIRSIDLPDTIQLIKRRAFAGCSNLTNMN